MARVSNLNQKRALIAFAIICTVFCIIIIRLAVVQILNNDYYKSMAVAQQTRDIPIEPKRGSILDRNGMKLAYSITTFNVWARPGSIKEKDLDETVKELAETLSMDPIVVKEKLTSKKDLIKITSGLNKATADLIKNKRMKGVWVASDSRREYPYNNFASYVIGHTTADNVGIAGVEQFFEKDLKGEAGRLMVQTDVEGRALPFSDERIEPPKDGVDVVLTIDEIIQHFTEKAVDETLSRFKAKRVMAIVMDPKTGEILSMVAKPDYNPNTPRDLSIWLGDQQAAALTDDQKVKEWNRIWRNPIVSDTYEPGSTFKLITASAGLEEKVVVPTTSFNCVGYTMVSGVKIGCWSRAIPHGVQTLTEGLENSCNPVFMEIAKRLERTKFYKYINDFGVTKKTNITLPAEASSIYLDERKAGPVEVATMSFGHGISVTPLQMITAVSAIGNGGMLMEPRIVKSFNDVNGAIVKEFQPKAVRRTISEATSKQMLLMMESVVVNGSGKKAYIPGIRVGGKTGTSEKLIRGGYSKDLAFSSFVGVAPVDDPKIAVLVVVDEPQDTNFGSIVAAPTARQIMMDTLRYLKVEPDFRGQKTIVLSDFVGKTVAEATKEAEAKGYQLSVSPVGASGNPEAVIVNQYPQAGKQIQEGGSVIIYVSR